MSKLIHQKVVTLIIQQSGQRFARYRTATKLSKEDKEVQISTLIYAKGIEAENIFKSFTFTAE